MLDAIITDGPNAGLSLREAIALGLILTGDNDYDTARAKAAREQLEKLSIASSGEATT